MSISEIVIKKISIIYRVLKLRLLSKEQIIAVKNNLIISLQENLKNEIKYVETKSTMPYANIIVETAKLKEIKSENIILIKMKVSEEGMEWQKIENGKGEIVTKLIPE